MLRLSSGIPLAHLKQTTQLGFFLHTFTDAQIRTCSGDALIPHWHGAFLLCDLGNIHVCPQSQALAAGRRTISLSIFVGHSLIGFAPVRMHRAIAIVLFFDRSSGFGNSE
jgi:hypothetical protein